MKVERETLQRGSHFGGFPNSNANDRVTVDQVTCIEGPNGMWYAALFALRPMAKLRFALGREKI